ncbi:MAG: hypothetical protein CMH41_09605 [Micrococcales bacterium]|nr:hypothetical protein [Micrococcales bacterium]
MPARQNFQQQRLPLEWRRHGVTPVPRQPSPPASTATQRWIGRAAAAVVEISAGMRPADNLLRIVTPATQARLRILHATAAARSNVPVRRTTSVRVVRTESGVLEACAVVQGKHRCQAVAFQLRQRGERWLITAVEVR